LYTVSMTNTGGAILSIRSIVITGPDALSFPSSNNCDGGLAAGGSCTIRLRFNPQKLGANSGAVTITDGAAGSPHRISLTGTGVTAPALTLSRTTVNFGSQTIGTVSALQSVSLTNTGSTILQINAIQLSGPNANVFQTSTNCGESLAVQASCTLLLGFAPMAQGPANATITITTDAADSPRTIMLTGTGVLPN
jgi:trimeric autotransporter adhesin